MDVFRTENFSMEKARTRGTHVWGLVLAGGEGSRLHALTMRPCGTAVPKQFCSLDGGLTLLENAITRAAGVVRAEQICTIVARQHREWWAQLLRHTPEQNIVVQPLNRGTGIGILYSLLHILARDSRARVVLLPADHYVRDEEALGRSLQAALACIELDDRAPVLLGLEPEEIDTELGYILPGAADSIGGSSVVRFVEKPDAADAAELVRNGGLWNVFIIAASAQALLDMFTRRYAPVVMEMRVILSRCAHAGLPASAGWSTIADMYERLPQIDFSRDLLEGCESMLRVVRAPPCGWSDLGTPRRVAQALQRLTPRESPHHRTAMEPSAHMNLAVMHAQFEALRTSSMA